jgi:hypothetical protein
MDTIIEAVTVLVINWRIGLSVVSSFAGAVFLASALQWFTGAYGIGFVLVSLGAGMLWQGSADAARSASVKQLCRGVSPRISPSNSQEADKGQG